MAFKTKRLLITFIPLLLLIISFLAKDMILNLSEQLPKCPFYKITGLLCPGCGNTRAVQELLNFHFISSLRYNITIPLLIVLVVILYIQSVISLWIKPIKIIPKHIYFYIIIISTVIIYYIIRNLVNFIT